ncbi:hypothetical protein [Corynebacterium urealyticum]|uniref:hypothetical protein n=1 Tax=Corynebacterium urealyticum TaxID=43771 RepID=UPI0011E62A4A|nr:hypothetical protein [Corynebacterium urealyticum]TYR15617.1 hypothetical protein FYJ89_03570 [Corynebacterium urealyticum]TYR17953.1 hypothetical protein FYJ88_03770 [Corynebacterium urealyticum]
MPWKPEYEGEFPTLGWAMLDWYSEMLAQPDCAEYRPLQLTREQAQFVLNYYRLDPVTGKRVYRRALFSRPKKWGKSPMMGAIGCGEALGPVVFDGWDANGRPVGKPWAEVRTPWVQFAAVNEDQTRNAFSAVLEMLRQGPVMDYYDVDPMESFVALPKGRIEYITAAGTSKEGQRPVWAALDQTESWYRSNGGVNLAAVIRRNLAGTGGTSIETPNAYRPGSGSVSEASFEYAQAIEEGRARETSFLIDHREAPATTELTDEDSLREGLLYAYGDSAREAGGWVDIDRIMADIYDPASDPQDSRQYFLNQITHASDSWVSSPDLRAVVDPEKVVKPGERIVLGFDGSRGRSRGKADATALVGMRLSDKHLFEVAIWEKGPNDPQDWAPNPLVVDATVRDCFERFDVVGFYADPSGWTGQVAAWEAEFQRRLRVKASRNAPIAAWPRGKDTRAGEIVEQLRQAIVNREVSLSEAPRLLTHMLNARRRSTRTGYLLYKQFPESPDKIDGAYAAMMAYKAGIDAISGGFGGRGGRANRKRRKVLMA